MSWSKVLKLTWDPIKYSAKTIKNLNNKLADNITESDKSDTPAIISAKINSVINRGNWERWNLRLNKIPKVISLKITFNNYSSFNFSYTMFDDYSEIGDSNLKLNYDDRDLTSTSMNIGTLINADFGLRKSNFLPYIRIDFSEDLTEASNLKAQYIFRIR